LIKKNEYDYPVYDSLDVENDPAHKNKYSKFCPDAIRKHAKIYSPRGNSGLA